MKYHHRTKSIFVFFCLLFFLMKVYATPSSSKDFIDPLETFNRQIFTFNYKFDRLLYRPVAKIYVGVIPTPIRRGVRNAFNNIGEIPSLVNDLLQLDLKHAVLNSWRFVLNSTLGILGLFDVASHRFGLHPYKNDFGLTLAKWGVRQSPYLQIIFLGPSTFRDGIAIPANYYLNPTHYIHDKGWRYSLLGLRITSKRAGLLSADRLVDDAIDPYIFVRNAYLQKRQAEINRVSGNIAKVPNS